MAAILIQIFFLLLLFVFMAFFTAQFYNILFRGFAPFISTRRTVIERVLAELEIAPDGVICELGCGKAGFLRAARKKYPRAKLVGVEYALLPYLTASIQNALSGAGIILRKENIFKTDIIKADAIYCYLNPEMMAKLEKKFKEECKSGALIASFQFFLPNLEPEKVIELGKHEKIYFYKITR